MDREIRPDDAADREGGRAAAWCQALVRLRRGDDAGAIGRLLAPPVFRWQEDAFGLALLGAALPPDDRRMLAAGGMAALIMLLTVLANMRSKQESGGQTVRGAGRT